MDDLISRLSELRCQYNCFDENERDAYHALSEAIKALSDVPDTNIGDTINRQAAITAICEDGTWLESQGCTEITMCERKQRDADILSELPIADIDISGYSDRLWKLAYERGKAEGIVRCKDCIWRLGTDCTRFAEVPVSLDDYCSRAERKRNR